MTQPLFECDRTAKVCLELLSTMHDFFDIVQLRLLMSTLRIGGRQLADDTASLLLNDNLDHGRLIQTGDVIDYDRTDGESPAHRLGMVRIKRNLTRVTGKQCG